MTTAPAASPATIDPSTVRRVVLPNGLTVLVRRDTSAPVVAIVTHVKAGYFDETDDVVGIAHVLEHMFFKGTPTRGVGEIARETKALGGYLNAATIYDHTVYYVVLPSSEFEKGLDVQFDAYANSLIDRDELGRELEVIIQEAKRKSDNPGAVASETLFEILHDHHRIRRWRIGREPGLRKLTRDDVVGFYRNFYHPGNTILTIVGDVDPDEAVAKVAARHGNLPEGTPVLTPGPDEVGGHGFRYREWTGDIGQTQIAMGWRTPPSLDDATAGLDVLATILGTGRASRMYRAVRDRKLATSVSVYNYTPRSLGVFVVHAETPPERAREAARAIWSQLRSVREHGVSDGELQRAHRVIESRWIRRLEDMEGQANYLAEWEALGDWRRRDEYLQRLLSVSADEVTTLARRFLDPDEAGILVYRAAGAPAVAAATQIAEGGELLGGSVTGGAAGESFGWSVSVPLPHAAEAVELLADVAQHAIIPDAALETERAIALADLVALRDDMFRYPMRLATGAAFAGHAYGVPVTGDEDSLPRITAERVRAWHRARFLEGPTVLGIVGDAEHDELAAIMASRFGELRGGEVSVLDTPVWPTGIIERSERRDKAQTALVLLFAGPSRSDDARHAAHLIAGVASRLRGRFFDELRDKQSLTHTVHAGAVERSLAGAFMAYIATSPELEEVARAGLLREFARLRDEPVTPR